MLYWLGPGGTVRFWPLLALCSCDPYTDSTPTYQEPLALDGVYAVTDYVESTTYCDTSSSARGAWTHDYLQLRVDSLLGRDVLRGDGCDSPDGCDPSVDDYLFDQFDDTSAQGSIATATYEGGQCQLEWVTLDLVATDTVITVTQRVESVSNLFGIDLADCTAQQDAWISSRDCVGASELVVAR